jgi:hypothetical protein
MRAKKRGETGADPMAFSRAQSIPSGTGDKAARAAKPPDYDNIIYTPVKSIKNVTQGVARRPSLLSIDFAATKSVV